MKRSGIITLLTDFGLTDAYIAMMKGVILTINRDADIVDITHNINAGSIFQAARVLKDAYPYFPGGTVHVAVIDPGVGSSRRLMAFEAGGHFFVGPDNGIFWPIVKEFENVEILELTEKRYFLDHVTSTFHGREVFAPVAAHISLGTGIKQMGMPLTDPVKLYLSRPQIKDNVLIGHVVRVDHFGNIITNISRKDFSDFIGPSISTIHIRDHIITRLDQTYSDVEKGELLAIMNSSDMLEIAVNLGRAVEYIGKEPGELIGTVIKVTK